MIKVICWTFVAIIVTEQLHIHFPRWFWGLPILAWLGGNLLGDIVVRLFGKGNNNVKQN